MASDGRLNGSGEGPTRLFVGPRLVRMIMRFQIADAVPVLVRFALVILMLVVVHVTVAGVVGVRMGMLMNVCVGVLVHMLVRVRQFAVPMLVPVAVQMGMLVMVTMLLSFAHPRSSV